MFALIKRLPCAEPGPTIRRQLAKSSTGLAFNYRAACRGRSHAEFTAKLGVASEEADETAAWLEFIDAAGLIDSPDLERLKVESLELLAIVSKSVGTARYNERNPRRT